MDRVRLLNDLGIARFREALDEMRNDPDAPIPSHLLNDEATSGAFAAEVMVEKRSFADKREMGVYLRRCLAVADRSEVYMRRSLWSWLGLYYFDEICPTTEGKHRRVSRDEFYILAGDYRRNYRHLLATPYELAMLYPDDGAECLLCGSVDTHGDMMEQLASRQELVTNAEFLRVVDTLYYDATSHSVKRGVVAKEGPGTLRRLTDLKLQLDLTYDYYTLAAEDMLGLLPAEFDRWK